MAPELFIGLICSLPTSGVCQHIMHYAAWAHVLLREILPSNLQSVIQINETGPI